MNDNNKANLNLKFNNQVNNKRVKQSTQSQSQQTERVKNERY